MTSEQDELETLRYVVKEYNENFPCDGGCNNDTGPVETCSRHGRSPRELWERLDEVTTELQSGPPDGWFAFGSHAPYPWIGRMEFSVEKGSGGMSLWERPTQGGASEDEVFAAMEAYSAYREADGPGDAMKAALGAAAAVVRTKSEPTEKEVLAALNAHYRLRSIDSWSYAPEDATSLKQFTTKSIVRMRAALSAAAQASP